MMDQFGCSTGKSASGTSNFLQRQWQQKKRKKKQKKKTEVATKAEAQEKA